MASGFSPTAPGGPLPLSDRRIVLLGKAGAGKNRVVRVILRDTKLKEESEECFLYEVSECECVYDCALQWVGTTSTVSPPLVPGVPWDRLQAPRNPV
ncbi:hypothetical protein PGIGA_G00113520 [Pangasianodon gigas]|uniref:Uncharacterized protein n=1 Tax=Pangasianodon gigas TaxID=30993 RepID=A0ACC5WAM3_PANGG|nr:hypothetical protein [Pangasianodon gigas]